MVQFLHWTSSQSREETLIPRTWVREATWDCGDSLTNLGTAIFPQWTRDNKEFTDKIHHVVGFLHHVPECGRLEDISVVDMHSFYNSLVENMVGIGKHLDSRQCWSMPNSWGPNVDCVRLPGSLEAADAASRSVFNVELSIDRIKRQWPSYCVWSQIAAHSVLLDVRTLVTSHSPQVALHRPVCPSNWDRPVTICLFQYLQKLLIVWRRNVSVGEFMPCQELLDVAEEMEVRRCQCWCAFRSIKSNHMFVVCEHSLSAWMVSFRLTLLRFEFGINWTVIDCVSRLCIVVLDRLWIGWIPGLKPKVAWRARWR
jgi:hypothetical protein